MRIQRFETKVTASYTTDTARRQLTSIQARYNDLTSLQTKLLASNRLTASFTQNNMRDLLEMAAPVPVVYTTAKLLTAVKVAEKDEKATDKPVAKAPKKQSDAKALFEQMKKAGAFEGTKTEPIAPKAVEPKDAPDSASIRKLAEQADPLTKALNTKPSAAPAEYTSTKVVKPKLTVADVLNLVENFANTHEEAGDDDTFQDELDSAKTRIESLNLKELSPKLVELQRGILERLKSVKTKGKLENFLATESETLRNTLKKFEEEQTPAKEDKAAAGPTEYNKSKFLDLLDEIESAETDASEPGVKLAQSKTLINGYLEELHQEAFDSSPGEIKVKVQDLKKEIDSAASIEQLIEVSARGRKAIESFVSEEVRTKRLKDTGKQETAKPVEKEPDIEAAKEQLQYFTTALASAPKTLSKGFMATKLYPILDKIVGHVPSLKNFADFFKTEMDKQEKPTTKILKALGGTLVEELTKNLSEPDEPADDSIVEDPNDFSIDDADEEPTGFEFEDEAAGSAEPAAEPSEGKTGFEMDDEPVQAPTPKSTKSPRRVLDDDVEETPEPAAAPVEAPKPAAPPAAKSKARAPAQTKVAPAQTKVAPASPKPAAPPITEQQAAKPTQGQFDVSGQDGDLQLKPTSIKLDPANKQLVQKHQALAKDLNSLFYELQTVAARVNTSLSDSVPPKTIEAIQSSLGRLGEQVKISMLASLTAIREMTAAHIPKPFADTAKNLTNLLTKTIPTKIPPVVHTFMFVDEDDELCFTSYIVLTRPTDKQARTIPRLFIYLTYRTQKHKMYVCTSRNMLPLSEDLFRMPFTSPKTMAIGLDRLLSLDNFHSNLAKVDLRTVFGKGGVGSAAIINDFPAISSIEQDGEELVFALSDSIGEGQEALVERQANQLENRLKLGLAKKFRIFKSYKFVNTAINSDDVYSDPADNKTAEPKTLNKPTPHFEIRLSFTAVPGAEPITTADLDFLKDRFIKLNDDAIRRMVRIANES